MRRRARATAALQRPDPDLRPDFQPFGFRLPWPTSTNNLWRNAGPKKILKSEEARLFSTQAQQALTEQRVPCRYIGAPIEVTIIQHAPSARGDVDNGVKITLDTMKKFGVIHDDNRNIVRRVILEDGERSRGPGWIWVEVRPFWARVNAFAGLPIASRPVDKSVPGQSP